MPRNAHGRPLLKSGPVRPSKRKPQRSAALSALETAERQNPDAVQIRQHRLGEIEDDSDVPETRADADGRSNKRRKVTNDREEEDDVEEGSDLEGGTWHTGVDDEDEDSDLDSDEAFGESDEEKFAGFTFRGSSSTEPTRKRTKPKRVQEVNLEEDDSELDTGSGVGGSESDDLGDDAVDLAAAWDMDDADERDERVRVAKKVDKKSRGERDGSIESEGSDNASGSEKDSEDLEDEESQFSVSEDEMDGDASGLRTFVEGLSSSMNNTQKQVQPAVRSLPAQPSRFGLSSSKLSAADLLQYVKDPTQRQSLKILQNADRAGAEVYKGGIPGKLSAPLAKRQQDRLNRGAAYEQSKETLNRWIDTVKQNRRAEHLSFPLPDHAKESLSGKKQLAPTSQSAPVTNLEATINEIMQESGMAYGKGQSTEEQEQAFEELAAKEMDVEELKARRTELRMARELMFREEIRAKRIKKIKSKAFRRVHRKEKNRVEAQQRETLAAAGLLNSDEEREKEDRRRAEERMGARHRESKWAKGVKQAGRATWDEDARAAVSDLARRDEELRRRVMGKHPGGSEASDIDDDSESDDDADSDVAGQRLVKKVDALESADNTGSKSKLGQMAFMQRAEAARRAENDEQIRQIRLAMDDTTADLIASEDEYQEPTGRQKFGVHTQAKAIQQQRTPRNEFEARLDDSEDDDGVDHAEPIEVQPASSPATFPAKRETNHQQNGHIKSKKSQPKTSENRHRSKKTKESSSLRLQAAETTLGDYTSSSDSEEDISGQQNSDEAKAALAASIFAGPHDTVQEFAKEKSELVEEEGDQVVDNTLPGWGNWTGAGVSKREQKKGKGRFLTTIKGVAPEKRQDAKLDRVIINEKRVKKNGKYLATDLPHPFESQQQYERSLRLPIGPEWSTTKHYQDSIKPRILLKQGTVIRPIAKPIA